MSDDSPAAKTAAGEAVRYTAGDVLARPTRLSDWWLELPFRRNARNLAWWRWLLFEKGQGWLRWGYDTRDTAGSYLEPPEPYGVCPPLRRLFDAVRYRARWPFTMRDEDRRLHLVTLR